MRFVVRHAVRRRRTSAVAFNRRHLMPAASACLTTSLFFILLLSTTLYAQTDIINTKHNLSVTGPGTVKALTENRICVFCHTPHNATPFSPLWNKELQPQIYDVYTSQTLKAGPLPQPTGPTKLCLSCHDGTIAMGAVVNPAGGINMSQDTFPGGSLANFGLSLSSHHPVSFPYNAALPNLELVSTLPSNLTFGGADEVHCTTCHDPHKDTFGKFLLMDNRFSGLCTSCHQMNEWATSAHATSTASVIGILPIPPKTWPTWTQLNEWGCEVCHTPHFAATPEGLLNFTSEPPNPYSCTSAGCHSAEPPPIHTHSVPAANSGRTLPSAAVADIAGQIKKVSAHHEPLDFTSGSLRAMTRSDRATSRIVTCADCHNPHQLTNSEAKAPYVSGRLQSVSGINRYGADVASATYEYEVCFKCHSDATPDLDYVPRVVNTTNTRLEFDPSNVSYHPVVSLGRNLNIPSIPSNFEPGMTASAIVYCSDCHADDGGESKGPHGSSFPPILKERYETTDHTPENYENYALCYRCHNRDSILSDVSFRRKAIHATGSGGGHSGHLATGAPCSACHDPHGVRATQESGSHSHLINFDTRIVLPKNGGTVPVFQDTGEFSGTCTLVCHGVEHDNFSYP